MDNQQFDWKQCMQYAAVSDVGMRRANNQDAYCVVLASDVQHWYDRGHIFLVADGMGAHAAGELASKLAADGIPHLYHKYYDKSPPEALQKAILETNAEVHRRGEANPDFHNMGTTTSAMLLLPQGALIAHIGDSRVYFMRGDTLRQLTFDHSLVWEMKAAGQFPEGSDAQQVVPKNVITRSLGPNPHVKIDFEGPYPVQVGDTFLLCSDGLTGKVEDEEIGSILANLPADEAAQVLVDLANLRGGPDNITVVVVKITSPDVTTAVVQADPLVIGANVLDERSVHPVVWVVMGVLFLAAIVLGVSGYDIAALIAGCTGVMALTVGILQKYGNLKFGISKEVELSGGKRLGKGPYTTAPVAKGKEFAVKLAETVAKLRDAAQHHQWEVNWDRYNDLCHQAAAADKAGNHKQATRLYCSAISFMMQQMRDFKKREADSKVDLF